MLETPGSGPRPYWFAPAHVARFGGRPVDLAAENAAAIERLRALPARASLVVVPGYTPVRAREPVRLHEVAERRLERAVQVQLEHGASGILVSGGNVHPDDTPHNEAMEMKRHLVSRLGLPADRVLIDPYARHTTTNLRNAGRFMLAHGFEEALVVTTFGQGFYIGAQDISSFRLRCERELGYTVGRLEPNRSFTVIRFRPSPDVWRRGTDPLDP